MSFKLIFFFFEWLRANAGNIYTLPTPTPPEKKKKIPTWLNPSHVQRESPPLAGASNVLLITNVTFDSLLNAACHPILLKLIIKFDNASDKRGDFVISDR